MTESWRVWMRTGALGDFLLSLPLLRAISRQGAPICLITRRAYLPLLAPGCRYDRFFDCDSAGVAALFAGDAVQDDLAECLTAAELYLFLCADSRLERALRRCGVRHITWLHPRPTAAPHVSCRFLEGAGYPAPARLVEEPLWPGPTGGSPYRSGRFLWIHPGSGSYAKNWPPGCFAGLAAAWQQLHDEKVVVSFGEADTELRQPVADALTRQRVRWEPRTDMTLAELKDRLAAETALYIGNDSGVSHLAAAVGIPSIVLFRTTDPTIWRPLGHCLPLLPADLAAACPATMEAIDVLRRKEKREAR